MKFYLPFQDPSPRRVGRRGPLPHPRAVPDALRSRRRVVRIQEPRPSSRSLSPPRSVVSSSSERTRSISPSRGRPYARSSTRPSSSSRSPLSSFRSDHPAEDRRPPPRSSSSSPARKGRSPRMSPRGTTSPRKRGEEKEEGQRLRSPRDRVSLHGDEDNVEDGVMTLEEIEGVSRWAQGVREELRSGDAGAVTEPLPTSRLSVILQQLADGTFDEEKYLLGKRVDHFMSRASKEQRGVRKGDSSSPTWPPAARRPAWPERPSTSAQPPQPPPPSQGSLFSMSHPPPLYSHLARSIGPLPPRGSLQDFEPTGFMSQRSEVVETHGKKTQTVGQRPRKSRGQNTESSRQEQRDQATSAKPDKQDQATESEALITKDQGTGITRPPRTDQSTGAMFVLKDQSTEVIEPSRSDQGTGTMLVLKDKSTESMQLPRRDQATEGVALATRDQGTDIIQHPRKDQATEVLLVTQDQGTESMRPPSRDQTTESMRVITRDQGTESMKSPGRDQTTESERIDTKDQGTESMKPPKRDQATESVQGNQNTKSTGTLTVPSVSQAAQTGSKISRLRISPQAWVNIRNHNVSEILPGVSIIPQLPQEIRSPTKHTLVELVHPNTTTDESASEVDEARGGCLQEDDQALILSPEISPKPLSGVLKQNMGTDSLQYPIERQEMGHSHDRITEPRKDDFIRSDVDDSRLDLRSPRDVPGGRSQEGAKGLGISEQGHIEYVYVFEDEEDEQREPQEERLEQLKHGEREESDLSGHIPKSLWDEVTIYSQGHDDDDDATYTRMLQELEGRMLEFYRSRMLNRAEEQASRLSSSESHPRADNQEPSVAPEVDVTEDSQEEPQIRDASGLPTKRTPSASPSPRGPSESPIQVVVPPADTPREMPDTPRGVPDEPLVEQVPTPSPSPPPSEPSQPARALTPQISQEEPEVENPRKDVATPPSSPLRDPSHGEKQQSVHTPSPTPASSPVKHPRTATPSHSVPSTPRDKAHPPFDTTVTPPQSPVQSERPVTPAHTPSKTPSPQKSPKGVVTVQDTPTPSVMSPGHLSPHPPRVLSPDESLPREDEHQPRVSPPRRGLGDTIVLREDRRRHIDDEDIQIEYANESVDLLSPETPSVVCHSSSDVTVASSVEVCDITGMSISDGEILGGPTHSVNVSLEAGEVAKPDCLSLLTTSKTEGSPPEKSKVQKKGICRYHESILQRSVGEVDDTEMSEGLLLLDDPSILEDKTIQDSPEQSFALDNLPSEAGGSVQVSVVRDESYSSGDTQGLPRQHLDVLRQENAQLLARLSSLGSSSFLRSFQSSSSSSYSQ